MRILAVKRKCSSIIFLRLASCLCCSLINHNHYSSAINSATFLLLSTVRCLFKRKGNERFRCWLSWLRTDCKHGLCERVLTVTGIRCGTISLNLPTRDKKKDNHVALYHESLSDEKRLSFHLHKLSLHLKSGKLIKGKLSRDAKSFHRMVMKEGGMKNFLTGENFLQFSHKLSRHASKNSQNVLHKWEVVEELWSLKFFEALKVVSWAFEVESLARRSQLKFQAEIHSSLDEKICFIQTNAKAFFERKISGRVSDSRRLQTFQREIPETLIPPP